MHGHGHSNEAGKTERFSARMSQAVRSNEGSDEEEHLVKANDSPEAQQWSFTPLVLMIGLSVHSLFEGIATGLVETQSGIWTLAIAIFLHKWAEAMALGISFAKNFQDRMGLVYLMLTIFSFATPVGIAIGMIVGQGGDLLDIIFNSLAGGTFTYIACSEVVVEEFSIPKYKGWKILMFLLGAGLITSLGFLE